MDDKNNVIRLMTFNILVDKRTDKPYSWEHRSKQIVSLLKYYNPDIFCIQEALEHQKNYLAECLTEYDYFGVGRNDGKQDGEQVPIFYRKNMFELKGKGFFWLSETPDIAGSIGWNAKCPRTVVWNQLLHKASNHLLIISNTHYDHIGKTANVNSANLITEKLSKIPPSYATLLCGDFNSSEETPPYKEILSNEFVDAAIVESTIYYGLPFTYHRFSMDRYITEKLAIQAEHDRVFKSIDHIFYKGNLNILRYGVLADNELGVYPSDHFPVLCDFNLL